jgi:molybdopterin-guanine dinucleotide biosynthesis protein A
VIPLSVAVLVGGKSQRMGEDKALLRLRPNDPPLLQLVIDRVRPLTDDLVLVGPHRPGYEHFGIRIVPDSEPGIGPLAGIASALAHAKHDACLVVACDMPFLNSGLLAYMAGVPRTSYDALVPLIPADSDDPSSPPIYQTLHASYQRACLAPIQRHLAAGNRRVTAFYADVRLRPISTDEIRVHDPLLRSFVGVNTPEAVERARIWLGDSPSSD